MRDRSERRVEGGCCEQNPRFERSDDGLNVAAGEGKGYGLEEARPDDSSLSLSKRTQILISKHNQIVKM